jgi:hypothetical protein
MPKRIRDLTALTPATGDVVAIDRPGGSTGRATIAANPTPNTLALRNAQGAVQDGAVFDARTVLRAHGIYLWNTANVWVPLVKWTIEVSALVGIFADLNIIRVSGQENIGSRLRVRAAFTNGTPANSRISLANDQFSVVANAVLVQTETNTVELWGYFPAGTDRIYVQGVAGINRGSVELTPYGNVTDLSQASPPSSIGNGLYLAWNEAPIAQTLVGPGYIVAASRNASSGYIRYDNGIQVCWGIVQVGDGTWTFPAAFSQPPLVQATAMASSAVPRVVTLTNVSTAAVGILRTDLSGNVQSGIVHLYAIGLWK